MDFFCVTLHIFVEIAVTHLAGADTGADTGLLDVAGIAEQGVTMGTFPIANGNGPGMTLAVCVVGAFRNFTLGYEGHINGHFHHGLLVNRVG